MKKAGVCAVVAGVLVLSAVIFGGETKRMGDVQYHSFIQNEMNQFYQVIVPSSDLNLSEFWTLQKPIETELQTVSDIRKHMEDTAPPAKFANEHKELVSALKAFEQRDRDLLEYAKTGDNNTLQKAISDMRVCTAHINNVPEFAGGND